MRTLTLYTWTHHRAHPLALSQHVILMMRCGMPHYRHTQPCSYSTIDGPGAFFTSLDPPGVMLKHKVPAHTHTHTHTHTLKQNTGFADTSPQSSYAQRWLICNGKLISAKLHSAKIRSQIIASKIWKPIFHLSSSMCRALSYLFHLANSWFKIVWWIHQLGCYLAIRNTGTALTPGITWLHHINLNASETSSTWDKQGTGRGQWTDV